MLAIAGVVTWFGYLVMTYGLSQLTGQNYSFLDLAIPGKFTLGSPAPDPPGTKTNSQDSAGFTTKAACEKANPGITCVKQGSGWYGGVKPPTTGSGYSTQSACEKATGMPCLQAKNGKWYGFTGKIKGT
jgi:hypothetical protein